MSLPDPVWRRLNLAWACFFAAMGFINLYVAYSYSEETWVNFKLFGGMGLMLALSLVKASISLAIWKRKKPDAGAIVGEDVPNNLPGRMAVREAHLERLKVLQGEGCRFLPARCLLLICRTPDRRVSQAV